MLTSSEIDRVLIGLMTVKVNAQPTVSRSERMLRIAKHTIGDKK